MSVSSTKEHDSSPGCIQYLQEVFTQLADMISPSDQDKIQPFFVTTAKAKLREYSPETAYYQIICQEEKQFIAIGCDVGKYREYLLLSSYLLDKLSLWLREQYTPEDLFAQEFSFISYRGRSLNAQQAAEYIYDWAKNDIHIALGDAFGIDTAVINQLSISKQEQEEVKGNLLFYGSSEEENICAWSMVDLKIGLTRSNLRLLGKLIMGTSPDHGLLFRLSDAEPICMGAVEKERLSDMPLCITIQKPLKWELSAFQRPVLQYIHGEIHFPDVLTKEEKKKIQENQIRDHLCRIFGLEEDAAHLDILTESILAVSEQDHGAAAIVADWSKGKCKKRLGKLIRYQKAIPVCVQNPLNNPDVLTRAAKMDGAVMINVMDGQVIALATILDGLTCVQGNPARGSRYNSVRNFTKSVGSSKAPVASFVFSSDGGMDVFPLVENTEDCDV